MLAWKNQSLYKMNFPAKIAKLALPKWLQADQA